MIFFSEQDLLVLLSDQEKAIPKFKLALIQGIPRYNALDAYFYLLVACQFFFFWKPSVNYLELSDTLETSPLLAFTVFAL